MIEDYTKGESEMVEPSGEPKRGAEEEKDELPDDWEDRHVKYLTGEKQTHHKKETRRCWQTDFKN